MVLFDALRFDLVEGNSILCGWRLVGDFWLLAHVRCSDIACRSFQFLLFLCSSLVVINHNSTRSTHIYGRLVRFDLTGYVASRAVTLPPLTFESTKLK